jgi:hypothetical protein
MDGGFDSEESTGVPLSSSPATDSDSTEADED